MIQRGLHARLSQDERIFHLHMLVLEAPSQRLGNAYGLRVVALFVAQNQPNARRLGLSDGFLRRRSATLRFSADVDPTAGFGLLCIVG